MIRSVLSKFHSLDLKFGHNCPREEQFPMPKIQVRAAEPADITAIHEIFTCPKVIAGTLQPPYPSIEQTRERFTRFSAGSIRLVAEVDGRVVGILGLHPE